MGAHELRYFSDTPLFFYLIWVIVIILTHGHHEYTGGLNFLENESPLLSKQLLAHSNCFKPKGFEGLDIGSPLKEKEVLERFNVQ